MKPHLEKIETSNGPGSNDPALNRAVLNPDQALTTQKL